MPYNGAGNFTPLPPPQYPAIPGDVIRASYFNAVINDLIAGLTNAITRDGQSPPSSNLPMAGKKHLAVADATAVDQYASYGQLLKSIRVITPQSFGAVGDGVTDDTAALIAALNSLSAGSVLDLGGKIYSVYNSVLGVSSGDAVPLGGVLRLSGKSNCWVTNGTIQAYNPGVSGPKLRYPSTLAIDGCDNIRFYNVVLKSKGENYGDSDASSGLGYEPRRAFLAQNGGHALVVIRSKNCRFYNTDTYLCGSVGAFYVTSSDDIYVYDSYSTAQSLGYAAYCADSWCGPVATSGFPRHELVLSNCSTDNNGATYGSKGGVVGEDADVLIRVYGGAWRDCYANGGATFIGTAFSANSCKVYVTGGQVDNCAAIGGTTQSTVNATVLEVSGVKATNLRTSMHIQASTPFGSSSVKYENCDAEIIGTSLWGTNELSLPTVVANMKITSQFNIDVIDCVTQGAHTFALNMRASYGGIRVFGGQHTVTDRIFDSAGWGGASAGSPRGYELRRTRFYVNLANTSVVSTAKTQATTAMNAVKNQDSFAVFTYQFVDFDAATSIESNLYRDFMALQLFGGGLQERRILSQKLNSCYQLLPAGEGYVTTCKVISQDGLTGSNAKVTLTFNGNKAPATAYLIDDLGNNRILVSAYAGPTISGSELRYGYFLNTNAYNLTVGTTYQLTTQ